MKEIIKKIYKKTEASLGVNTGKIITVILFGILLLVVVIPADGCSINTDGKDTDKLLGTGITETDITSGSTDISSIDYNTSLFDSYSSISETSDIQSVSSGAEYYEARLKNILETSYGDDSVSVMVHMTMDSEKSIYGDVSEESVIDGVLVVADVETAAELLEITEAVCALFNLPACKVYVIKKS